MKLRLAIGFPKTSRSRRKVKFEEPKALNWPASLLEDPAFSEDPRSNPYNLTPEQDIGWAVLNLGPGHPTLQKRRRQRRSKLHGLAGGIGGTDDNNDISDLEPELIQPPNSPVLGAQGPSPSFHEPDPIPLLPPPANPMPIATVSRAESDGGGRSVRRLLTKKRGTKAHKATQSLDGHDSRSEAATTVEGRNEVQLQRHNSAPQSHRQDSITAWAQKPPVRSASRTAGSNVRPSAPARHVLPLDSIDELDESNLFGAPLHHDGPYETVKSVIASPPRMPLGYHNDGRLYQYHERMLNKSGHLYELPRAPDGISLNISPGQLVPRNFKREQRKSPRFRNILSPQPPQPEVTQPLGAYAPTVAPRHQKYNQIPFHAPRNGGARHNRGRPVDENPLDGPDFDPSVVIGLAMMNGTMEPDSPPPSAVVPQLAPEPQQDAAIAGTHDIQASATPKEDDDKMEFDPYDPKSFEHPFSGEQKGDDWPADRTTVSTHQFPPRPASVALTHLSEDDFHNSGNNAEAMMKNPQFTGIPDGVQVSVIAPVQEKTGARNAGDAHPFTRPAPTRKSLEETPIQHDENMDDMAPNVTQVPPPTSSNKADITVVKDREVLHTEVISKSTSPPKVHEPIIDGEGDRATFNDLHLDANREASPPGVNPTDIGYEISRNDDISAFAPDASRPRYEKQLPPSPPTSRVNETAAYRVEPVYTPPHLRSPSSDVSVQRYKPSVADRKSTPSRRQSLDSSVVSYTSITSTQGDDGHTTNIYNPQSPAQIGHIMFLKKRAAELSKAQASKKGGSPLPDLLAGFEPERPSRYPQPPQPSPAPPPAPRPTASSSFEQRTPRTPTRGSRGSATGSTRSQASHLSPIREDRTEESRRDKSSTHSSDGHTQGTTNLGRESSQGHSSSAHTLGHESTTDTSHGPHDRPPYSSHIRIEVGQGYPQHYIPLGTNLQRPELEYSTHQLKEPLRRPLMPINEALASSLSLDKQRSFERIEKRPEYVQNPPIATSRPDERHMRSPPPYIPSSEGDGFLRDEKAPIRRVSPATPETSAKRRPLRVVNPGESTLSDSVVGPSRGDDRPVDDYGTSNERVANSGSRTVKSHRTHRSQMSIDDDIRPEDSVSNRVGSIAVTHRSSRSNQPPPPVHRHMPKKLVMPAPLQPLQEGMAPPQPTVISTSTYYQDTYRTAPKPSSSSQYSGALSAYGTSRSMSAAAAAARTPSPPHILPRLMAQEYRTTDVLQAAAGKKLKKRMSYIPAFPLVKSGEVSPTEPLNFDPTSVAQAAAAELKNRINLKAVTKSSRLSKKRTGL